MGYPTVKTDIQTIGGGAFYDVQPAAYESFRVIDIGSDEIVGVPPNAVPNVNVALYDGALEGFFLRGADVRGWYRKQNFVIDNDKYLRLTNNAVGVAQVSFSAELIRYSGVGESIVRSDLATVGAAAIVSVQPPTTGQDWVIYDFGSSRWVGAAPNGLPDIEVDLDDGVATARILSSIETRQWEAPLRVVVNNAEYVTLTNSNALAADICWSAELLRYNGSGFSVVRNDVQVAGAGADVLFQPPDGEEWSVNMIGSSNWVGISPAQFPDITASLFDGVLTSPLENAANWRLNGHPLDIRIDHDHYLTVNDASGAGQNIGISAELLQRYA